MKTLGHLVGCLVLASFALLPLQGQDESQLDPLFKSGDYTRARTLLAQLIEREPLESRHRYNLACAEAHLGFTELALDALATAVRLGFNDRELLLTDGDLAPLRSKGRFKALAQLMTPAGPSAATTPKPAAPTTPTSPAPLERTELALPVAPRLTSEGPVGLYFMTRFWMSSGLEQKLWYFDADGRIYQSPGSKFTPEALDRTAERRGRRMLVGEKLKVTWSDGKVTESQYKADANQSGFSWDAGIFSAVPTPDWSKVAGYFEGGASFSSGAGGGTSVSGLTLRADGTFAWSRSASLRGLNQTSQVTAGSVSAPQEGRWKGEGYQIALTFSDGRTERFVAFPTLDPADKTKIGMLFFNGSMHLAKTR